MTKLLKRKTKNTGDREGKVDKDREEVNLVP